MTQTTHTKTIAFHTLGCKLNFAESSDLLKKFTLNGYTQIDFHEKADVYVINTCSVTQIAEKKCRNAIRQASHLNPKALIAVIGCFATLRPKEIQQIEGVDIILGNEEKHKLYDYVSQNDIEWLNTVSTNNENVSNTPININNNIIASSAEDRTRCFLKIQDGCDYFCSYCTIPYARGRSRSAKISEVIDVIKKIEDEGKKEIILSGINIGTFGKTNGETFFDLIKALEVQTNIERYRISSIEPNLLTEEMIDFIAESRSFLPHFHIPLQAGTDFLLTAMKRKYDTHFFSERLHYIHSKLPQAFIAADVIVGFCGETEVEFEKSKTFIENLEPLSALHVFTYSERPNTFSVNLTGKVPHYIRKQRSFSLQKVSQKKKLHFYNRNSETRHKVLWESNNDCGYMYGFTDNYIRVCKPFNADSVNTIEEIKLENLDMEKMMFVLNG
ncbi:MAG: tRNA (N(6)-L-threonylcarbamoyladenosine(37)-C(2))-methylthiotransferase MtaB [Bacteroidales bacterium]|jgi:threonylcarbamoyladenosine tRNA methylthiotransferase MtaB|nr:tRNA (N(6)-L-threonylcarbamoyladenosine(37)-C(2))-methylthiotransferase MtaB [Bacteroidales bacterium]